MSDTAKSSETLFYFYCKPCKEVLFYPENEIRFEDEVPVMLCPICEKLTLNITRQRYANILNARKSTGPKTEEGKQKCGKNLDGHRGHHKSQEAHDRATCNNYKHGNYSKILRPLAPAIHGRYPQCEDCEMSDVCEAKEIKWCPIVLQPMLRFIQAAKEKDPSMLHDLAGATQAKFYTMLEMAMKEVFEDGVSIEETIMIKGGIKTFLRQHPALISALQIVDKVGFTAEQQKMTPAKADESNEMLGFLKESADSQKSVFEYMQHNNEIMNEMRDKLLQKSEELRQKDEALMQYKLEKDVESEKE